VAKLTNIVCEFYMGDMLFCFIVILQQDIQHQNMQKMFFLSEHQIFFKTTFRHFGVLWFLLTHIHQESAYGSLQ